MLRVAIVDDDPWVREGRAAALQRSGVEVVHLSDHIEALSRDGWDDVDVLLVDAHNSGAEFDRFQGVRVVEKVRSQRPKGELRIVVLTGHAFNDLLRIRMAEAGADVMFAHDAVRSADDLMAVVDGTGWAAAEVDDGARSRVGVAPGGHVNRAVAWAEQHLGEAALEPGRSQKSLDLTRRRLITARRRVSDLTGMAGGSRSILEWREVAAFLQRARGAERRS
ncbi:MAG: response regulator [Actinomycetota bacterium]